MVFAQRSLVLTSSIALALSLSACGGSSDGGSSNGGEASNPTSVKGAVADGYLVGAKVCLDMDNNKVCGASEPSAITGTHGAYTLTVPAGTDASKYPLLAEITAATVDEDTNKPVAKPYLLTTPAGQTFISPLTTLVQAAIESTAMPLGDAQNYVNTQTGGVAANGADLLKDYVTKNQKLHDIAKKVASLLAAELAKAPATMPKQEALQRIAGQVNSELGVIVSSNDMSKITVDFKAPAPLVVKPVNAATVLQEKSNHFSAYSYIDQTKNTVWQVYHTEIASKNGNQIVEKRYYYDFATATWKESSTHNNDDLYLTASGWKSANGQLATFTVNADGSLNYKPVEGAPIVTIRLGEADVAGKKVGDYAGYGMKDVIKHDAVFSQGAKIYTFTSSVPEDTYTVSFDQPYQNQCSNGIAMVDASVYNGNCNTVWGNTPNGPATRFADLLYPATWQSGDPIKNAAYIGGGKAILTGDATNLAAGGKVYVLDYQTNALKGTYAWSLKQAYGQDILVADLPYEVSYSDEDETLVVQNGFVRRGNFERAGTVYTNQSSSSGSPSFDYDVNGVATQDIKANLQKP